MKLKKLLVTLLIMMLSTGVLFACSAEDPEGQETNNDTEQLESEDTESDSGAEED